jgi:anti-sigma regulatory factor (Ser/Thr protein kinase)
VRDRLVPRPAKVPDLPLSRHALELPASPRSVQDARRWVAGICRELGREDLVYSAELGVSELVTNALLHAGPPFRVRVRGTPEHPRVEVSDGSINPPTLDLGMTDEDGLLSTIGRGLAMLAMHSTAWGADIDRNGKVVWFLPAAEPNENVDLPGSIDIDDAVSYEPLPVVDGIVVQLLKLPVGLYADFRRHYRELRRELRLLSLADETSYPIAKSLSDLFLQFERELLVGVESARLEEAIQGGLTITDHEVEIPRSAPATIKQMLELLELADAFCRAERLLALATTAQQHQFQRWYLGEFVRQGRGESAVPWAGDAQVKQPKQSAS